MRGNQSEQQASHESQQNHLANRNFDSFPLTPSPPPYKIYLANLR